MRREDILTAENSLAMRQHSLEAYPNEACGVILSDKTYKPMINVSPRPDLGVRWDSSLEDMIIDGQVLAMFHSHPWTPEHQCWFAPSERDMVSQIHYAVPWALLWTNGEACSQVAMWGDQLERLPLLGRTFQHAISDCYELIRDQKFIEEDLNLPQFPRSWEWWKEGKDLYTEGFPEAKFHQITHKEVEPNDVVLFRVRSKVPNHGGIIREGGLLLHHPSSRNAFDPTRKSMLEPLGRWLGMNPIWLRYSEDN